MVHSGTMKASPKGGGPFRSGPAQGSLGPVSEVCGVSSNRDVPSPLVGNQGQQQ